VHRRFTYLIVLLQISTLHSKYSIYSYVEMSAVSDMAFWISRKHRIRQDDAVNDGMVVTSIRKQQYQYDELKLSSSLPSSLYAAYNYNK